MKLIGKVYADTADPHEWHASDNRRYGTWSYPMTSKPETLFYRRIHKKMRCAEIDYDKTNNMYKGGIPDIWYSGPKADLWAEYKYGDNDLSPLQAAWLRKHGDKGRNVAVVYGWPGGNALVIQGELMFENYSKWKKVTPWTEQDVADWLVNFLK